MTKLQHFQSEQFSHKLFKIAVMHPGAQMDFFECLLAN